MIVAKFDDRLTSEVPESSRRSDHIWANEDMIDKPIEVPSSDILFSFVFVVVVFFFFFF